MTNSGQFKGKTNFRWAIVALLFFATTVNYFDRFLMGILAPLLEKEIGWTELQYGYIVSSFQFAYAAGTLLAGYVIDRLGTRWGFTLAVGLWSIASMFHAAARTWVGFAMARVGLGLSEAGNFPAAIKTVAEWFPKKERAFATGLFNGGSNVGAILAPILIPLIIAQFGSWKWVFILSGFLGVFWLVFWLILYRVPGKSRYVNQAEIDFIKDGEPDSGNIKISWYRLIKYRQTWAVALGKLFADPVWWFYLYWGAKFLNSKFGVDLKELALPLVTIYVIADLGGIAGGAISSLLIKKGKTINFSRKVTMLGSALLVLPVMTVPNYSSIVTSVGFIALAAAAHCSWSANIFTVASDLFPKNVVATVTGFATTISTLGGMLMALLVGYVLNESGTDGYKIAFAVASFGYLIAIAVIHLLAPKMEPLTNLK
ncbi:MFS transporter [Maribellus comscasis]|uniref:MFS transporter n=1 Tax=Maribellus comscasis TaxID=2681766 RepID=A0A6I6JXT5_9BACT|nr:MFS transporter [Maribellus comscasis]QGY47976.1 MFS transporter [Maribellus comscasis]